MSERVVCYLERTAGGSLIRRVRLMTSAGGAGADRTWNAPALSSGEGSGGDSDGAAAVTATRNAARWVAEALIQAGTRKLNCLCIDPDGSLCTWLSAPSADPSVITATLMQPDADDGSGTSATGGGAARLLALGAGSADGFSPTEASVQALATLDPPGSGRGLTARLRGKSAPEAEQSRERYAVMAVPDAPVRVFLDELDARGIEVEQTMSLWHALAIAWDPGAAESAADSEHGARVVASVSPASAIMLVDPIGRLVWSWSQEGQLVAGGSMRLRTSRRRNTEHDEDAATTARRLSSASNAEAQDLTLVEFTESDTGRLVLDWLSWSAQLGHCPQRVACVGPAPAADSTAGMPDPALIGRSLGAAWPGAAIAVGTHDDPIGATLHRLLEISARDTARASDGPEVAEGSDDPRASLIGLSSRPGRADRSMYTWMAIGIVVAAAAVAAIGWQLHRAGKGAAAAIAQATKDRKTALTDVGDIVKDLDLLRPNEARDSLLNKSDELRKQLAAMKPAKPFLGEVGRVFKAIKDHDGVKVNSITIGPVSATVEIVVPDGPTGPAIVQTLADDKDTLFKWQGGVRGFTSVDGPRTYIISGPLIVEETRPGSPK